MDFRKNGTIFKSLPEMETKKEIWWKDLISNQDFEDYSKGPKVLLLFSILKECKRAGEKL